MRLVVSGNFPTVLELPTGSIVRLFIPLIVDQNFYNYKSFFLIVLLAIVGYDYKFIFADVSCQGRISVVEYTEIVFFIELPKRIY